MESAVANTIDAGNYRCWGYEWLSIPRRPPVTERNSPKAALSTNFHLIHDDYVTATSIFIFCAQSKPF